MHYNPVAATLLAAGTLSPAFTYAQETANYPSKPVRIIVGLAAGGAADIQSRIFASRLSETFGRQFIVENRPGVGSALAFSMVAKAAPDGHTLLAALPIFTYAAALQKDLAVDPIKDFAPVSLLSKTPWLLVVHPSLPAKSVRELVALAKAKPGALNFGGGGLGSGTHLVGAWFIHAANIKAQYIPYTRGTGQSTIDLVGGHIDASIVTVLTVKPFTDTGRLRILGISTAQRSKIFPDIPTIAEQGVPSYDSFQFLGWAATAGTPPAIVNRLSVELAKIARSSEMEEKIKDDGGEAIGSTPEQFKQFMAAEVPRWSKLIRDIGLKLE